MKTIKKWAHNTRHRTAHYLVGIASLHLISTSARADDLPALNNATRWVSSTLTSVALAVLGLQIMFRLWQVNQGQKEWSEVAKPILITGAIVAVPAVITALDSVMR